MRDLLTEQSAEVVALKVAGALFWVFVFVAPIVVLCLPLLVSCGAER